MVDQQKTRPKKRVFFWGSISSTLLIGIILALPSVLSLTPFRDAVLNSILGSDDLIITTQNASFGWLTPVTLEGLQLRSSKDKLNVYIGRLESDRTCWYLFTFNEELGHFKVDEAKADVDLNWQRFQGYSVSGIPDLSASLQNAGLTIDLKRLNEPVIDIGQFNIDLRVEQSENGRFLTAEKGKLFKNRKLTPELFRSLLQLMDPLLADVVEVEGEFNLRIDRLRVPLDVDPDTQSQKFDFQGELQLIDVHTTVKTPLLKGIVRVAADLHGKEPSNVVRIVNECHVALQVSNRRLHHSGLKLGLPDIAPEMIITSEGSVGLDETLDLHVRIPKVLIAEDVTTISPDQITELHITGTIQEPVVTELVTPETATSNRAASNNASSNSASSNDLTPKGVKTLSNSTNIEPSNSKTPNSENPTAQRQTIPNETPSPTPAKTSLPPTPTK